MEDPSWYYHPQADENRDCWTYKSGQVRLGTIRKRSDGRFDWSMEVRSSGALIGGGFRPGQVNIIGARMGIKGSFFDAVKLIEDEWKQLNQHTEEISR